MSLMSGLDERLGELGDERTERGADDDADREVDDVAAHDEFLEALDHVVPPCSTSAPTLPERSVGSRDLDRPARRSTCTDRVARNDSSIRRSWVTSTTVPS